MIVVGNVQGTYNKDTDDKSITSYFSDSLKEFTKSINTFSNLFSSEDKSDSDLISINKKANSISEYSSSLLSNVANKFTDFFDFFRTESILSRKRKYYEEEEDKERHDELMSQLRENEELQRDQIGGDLMESIKDMFLLGMAGVFAPFKKAFKFLLAPIMAVFKPISKALSPVFKGLSSFLGKGLEFISGVAKVFAPLAAVITVIEGFRGWGRAEEFFENELPTIGQRFASAFAGIVSSLSFGIINAESFANGIYDLFSAKNISSNLTEIKDTLLSGWNSLTEIVSSSFDFLKETIVDAFKGLFSGSTIISDFIELAKTLFNFATDVLSGFKNILIELTPIFKTLITVVSNTLSILVKSIMLPIQLLLKFLNADFLGIGTVLEDYFKFVIDKVSNIMGSVLKLVWDSVNGILFGIPQALYDGIDFVTKSIIDVFSSMIDNIVDGIKSLVSGSFLGKIFGFSNRASVSQEYEQQPIRTGEDDNKLVFVPMNDNKPSYQPEGNLSFNEPFTAPVFDTMDFTNSFNTPLSIEDSTNMPANAPNISEFNNQNSVLRTGMSTNETISNQMSRQGDNLKSAITSMPKAVNSSQSISSFNKIPMSMDDTHLLILNGGFNL